MVLCFEQGNMPKKRLLDIRLQPILWIDYSYNIQNFLSKESFVKLIYQQQHNLSALWFHLLHWIYPSFLIDHDVVISHLACFVDVIHYAIIKKCYILYTNN
jgi:hypothetical protein